MKKFQGLCIVSVNSYNQGELDKNGKAPVYLNVVAGKYPNRTVLSGTVAENAGFQTGKTYLAQVREGEFNKDLNPRTGEPYGRNFVWNALMEASMTDIVNGVKNFGQPVQFDAAVEVEEDVKIAANKDVE